MKGAPTVTSSDPYSTPSTELPCEQQELSVGGTEVRGTGEEKSRHSACKRVEEESA